MLKKFISIVRTVEKYNFDFTNRKIAFFSSPAGTVLRSKEDFFQYENGEIIGRRYFEIVELLSRFERVKS